MKKMMLVSAVVMSLVVSVFANARHIESTGHIHHIEITHMTSQGTHCNGTVGCDCKGFSPITNGDVWQQAYCKHCGHKKSSHK